MFVERGDAYVRELDARFDDGDEQVADLLAVLDDHGGPPESVLDVGCGVGRHAVAFARRGASVDGVDVSPTFVARARDHAADADVEDRTRFLEGDMRSLDAVALDPPYDLAVCLFTSFGYYDDATNLRVLEALHGRLAADGRLVVDTVNKDGVLAGFEESGVYEFGDDALVVEQRSYDPEASRVETDRDQFRRDDGDLVHEASYDISLRLYSPVEFRRLCEAAGFSDVTMYGDYDGGDLDRDSERLLAVARA